MLGMVPVRFKQITNWIIFSLVFLGKLVRFLHIYNDYTVFYVVFKYKIITFDIVKLVPRTLFTNFIYTQSFK